MRKRRARAGLPFPLLAIELTAASWETIAHRLALAAGGRCTGAEYRRMVLEKLAAARGSAAALSRRRASLSAVLSPWHRRAKANALRLRKRRLRRG